MNTTLLDRLRPIGFTPAVAQAIGTIVTSDETPGAPMRLIEAHRETVRVTDGVDEHSARPLPSSQRSLAEAGDALTVGDWLSVQRDEYGMLWVHHRMPPLTQIVRRDSAGARQSLVTSVDTAMLAMGLDGDFNPRRLERYLALVSRPASAGRDSDQTRPVR